MSTRPFLKMHGLGNDFVVVDARAEPFTPAPALVRAIADRRLGVGCDQLIVLEPPLHPDADVFMRIRNADGGEAGACGNAARCVARLLLEEPVSAPVRPSVVIETASGLIKAAAADGSGLITVDMGPARLAWQDIPLARAGDTLHLDIAVGPLADGVAVNMGNPHAVFFVSDAAALAIEEWGPRVETDPLFPERTNVAAVQVLSPARLRLKMWERGAGVTRACGTGACAALVAAHRRGLADREAEVELDGGTLHIRWAEDGHVFMTGPAAVSFAGTLPAALVP